MHTCRDWVFYTVLVASTCAVAPVYGADLNEGSGAAPELEEQQTKDGFHGVIALGGRAEPEFEGAADYRPTPSVYANLQAFGMGLEIMGPEAKLHFRPNASFQFGPAAEYRMGRDNVASNVIDRLDAIDGAFEVGGFAAYQFNALMAQSDSLTVTADLLADVTGVHEGVSGSIGVSYAVSATDRVRLSVDTAVGFASEGYMDTYFGVSNTGAAASGLAAYTAEGGIKDVSIGASASYALTRRWGIVGRAEYKRLLGDAADSPIVKQEGSADQFMGGIGLSYSF